MKRSFLLLLICAATFALYWPGTNGGFRFDDHPNIVQNSSLHIDAIRADTLAAAAMSGNSSVLKRPISMLSFGINHAFSGLNPLPYKITNIFLHCLNLVLVFMLTTVVARHTITQEQNRDRFWIPVAVTACWALSPINLTSVLYVVQRMASLSAFFSLAAVVVYAWTRPLFMQNRLKGLAGISCVSMLIVLSILAKETGVLTVLYLFAYEMIIFRSEFLQKRNITLIGFFSLALLLPAILCIAYTAMNPYWILNNYEQSEFTLIQRLLTEARVTWLYVFWTLIPIESNLALFHDDITYSNSLFTPLSTVTAIAGHVLLMGTSIYWYLKKKNPLFVFGIALFYAAHLLESTILALELVHEHRNYVAGVGLWLAVCSLLFSLPAKAEKALFIALPMYVLLTAFALFQRASNWGNDYQITHTEAHNHPNSYSANYELGRLYAGYFEEQGKQEDLERAIALMQKAASLDPGRADALLAILMIQARNGIPKDAASITELIKRVGSGPFYASYAGWMTSLVTCTNRKICEIDTDTMKDILVAAIGNKNIHNAGISKAVALTATANFVAHNGGTYQNALELSLEAQSAAPTEIRFVFNLISLASANNDKPMALKWIGIAEQKDAFGAYTKQISEFKRQIEDLHQ